MRRTGLLDRSAKWSERILWIVGVAALGYCGWFYGSGWYRQAQGGARLDRLWGNGKSSPARGTAEGAPIARIEIPRLHVASVVFEGTGDDSLAAGVGHLEGSALPGSGNGNVVLAGHRDTFFRPLRNIQEGDVIELRTGSGTAHYVVESTEIVTPDRTDVAAQTSDSRLTLVTCYPFRYIGSAPQRFIVHGRAVSAPLVSRHRPPDSELAD